MWWALADHCSMYYIPWLTLLRKSFMGLLYPVPISRHLGPLHLTPLLGACPRSSHAGLIFQLSVTALFLQGLSQPGTASWSCART